MSTAPPSAEKTRPSELCKMFGRLSVDDIKAELQQLENVKNEAIRRADELKKKAVDECKQNGKLLQMLLRAKGSSNGHAASKADAEERAEKLAAYLQANGPQKNIDLAKAFGLKSVVVHGVCSRRPTVFAKDAEKRWRLAKKSTGRK